jgi:putative SOS response-associated peptidase YedK
MCGRFTLTKRDFQELAAMVGADALPEYAPLYRPRYNIAPTDPHWIVRQEHEARELIPAKWGLVNYWAKDAKGAARQINARSETAATSRAFRDALERRRCVVPADGFFEWTGTKQARRPLWFHSPHDDLLLFAGLYESWMDPSNSEWMRTFTILTTSANDVVAPVHDRMPVILPPERVDDWLFVPAEGRAEDVKRVTPLLQPCAEDVLVGTYVSPRVNSVANDDPACLEPAEGDDPAAAPRLL